MTCVGAAVSQQRFHWCSQAIYQHELLRRFRWSLAMRETLKQCSQKLKTEEMGAKAAKVKIIKRLKPAVAPEPKARMRKKIGMKDATQQKRTNLMKSHWSCPFKEEDAGMQ